MARARRFAGFYLNEDPEAINYDPDKRIILAPDNGSMGPRPREGGSYSPSASMVRYGLPYEDIEGVSKVEDLQDPELARRMGAAMDERMSRGDVLANLGVVSLVTNAWLLTGEDKYQDWVLEYVGAWLERSEANGGLPPDNVGLSGEVGEYISGKWYGGLYGWTWPHGFYNIGMACVVASSCAYLISGEDRYLDLARIPIDRIVELGEERDPRQEVTSLSGPGVATFESDGEQRAFLVPHRYSDSGWFDYMPTMVRLPLALWNLTGADDDRQRVEHIRELERVDWCEYTPSHDKEDTGHERPWHAFLMGENPEYPEEALRGAISMVYKRIRDVREDDSNPLNNHIHQWQQLNPVTNETLIQLTLGAPQFLYNGGLMIAPLRYFDGDRRRPGLPEDVSALVRAVDRDRIDVELINLNAWTQRSAIVQAGSFGQHRFTAVEYNGATADSVTADKGQSVHTKISGGGLEVQLPPGSTISLRLTLERGACRPSYRSPWEA